VRQILGEGAEDFEARAQGQFMMGNNMDLSQFFMTEDDLERPDD
jgi:hypothetical protein